MSEPMNPAMSGTTNPTPSPEPSPPSHLAPTQTTSPGVSRVASFGALAGTLAVVMGAFGAHALKARLSPEALAWWKTAAEYHLIHALLLTVIGLVRLAPIAARPRALGVAAVAVGLGLAVFCGSLYTMALTELRWLGAITPLGGTAFIVGWFAFGWALWPTSRHTPSSEASR
jgi:uncharacterized membrane protein YgdD (TMEM256/DUF423 family)